MKWWVGEVIDMSLQALHAAGLVPLHVHKRPSGVDRIAKVLQNLLWSCICDRVHA